MVFQGLHQQAYGCKLLREKEEKSIWIMEIVFPNQMVQISELYINEIHARS